MKQAHFYFILLLILLSCNSADNNEQGGMPESQKLIGEWNNLSMKIVINSKHNTDTNDVFEVDRPQWEQRLQIEPIRTFFRADSSFNSAHYNLKDSLVYNPSGKWWIENDRLVMLQNFPSPDTTSYELIMKNDTASFEGMVDWDMDGKKDDVYFGRQIKVKK